MSHFPQCAIFYRDFAAGSRGTPREEYAVYFVFVLFSALLQNMSIHYTIQCQKKKGNLLISGPSNELE